MWWLLRVPEVVLCENKKAKNIVKTRKGIKEKGGNLKVLW